ncbi:hypothetical protein SARC_06816 [Sphaeroforma arctica JP610]|uniref:Uncharacterized protein n=1 Tax=Sphaeroforma arctica JP610 TaxID=667725 RepID=A0A0L0FW09_9EUKA|nr:hypothetical protein SARC_06816 [Sphaeroforma arctica JP610]KNC80834.1 hypothetical protein SARC_06816 [Sphaeroforma arctica JP610]|eukprot:XP_014154736.1 hypothetical protein SARC_06816 [Sphaeroforma arctica JP610]
MEVVDFASFLKNAVGAPTDVDAISTLQSSTANLTDEQAAKDELAIGAALESALQTGTIRNRHTPVQP